MRFSVVTCALVLAGVVSLGVADARGANGANTRASAKSANLAAAGANSNLTQTYTLDTIHVNSIGDGISESGIDEGILRKNMASGPLDYKSVFDVPYQVNTISRELLDNQKTSKASTKR